MTPKQYFNLLKSHDWFYYFSDDHRVLDRGEKELEELVKHAAVSPIFSDLFLSFKKYKFSGPGFGKPFEPCPSEPQE